MRTGGTTIGDTYVSSKMWYCYDDGVGKITTYAGQAAHGRGGGYKGGLSIEVIIGLDLWPLCIIHTDLLEDWEVLITTVGLKILLSLIGRITGSPPEV